MKTFKDYITEAKKISAYDVIDEVEKYGYKKSTEYNPHFTLFSKGPITVTVKKVKNNSNLKAMLGSWEGSSYTYSFDEKKDKTIQAFLKMLDGKDPKRKPTLSESDKNERGKKITVPQKLKDIQKFIEDKLPSKDILRVAHFTMTEVNSTTKFFFDDYFDSDETEEFITKLLTDIKKKYKIAGTNSNNSILFFWKDAE